MPNLRKPRTFIPSKYTRYAVCTLILCLFHEFLQMSIINCRVLWSWRDEIELVVVVWMVATSKCQVNPQMYLENNPLYGNCSVVAIPTGVACPLSYLKPLIGTIHWSLLPYSCHWWWEYNYAVQCSIASLEFNNTINNSQIQHKDKDCDSYWSLPFPFPQYEHHCETHQHQHTL